MTRRISLEARRELVRAIAGRYRHGSPDAKRRILDEFVALTGYHRKHAIRLLNESEELRQQRRRPRATVYDEAVRQVLIVLWEAADRVCGKRLKPLLGVLLPALERHGHLQLSTDVRDRVMSVSAATIDRMLKETRDAVRGEERARARAAPAVRRAVPVRTFSDWHDPPPGYVEADLVAHSGESVAGSFVHTLTLTDIATGWTECGALLVRDGSLVVEALSQLRAAMPFPLLGIDTDNGSEFMNATVLAYCEAAGIELTRSRPYRKNDQAWVEQKNGSVVRRLVGYRRLEGVAAAEALSRLYAVSRLYVNFFQPSFKLAEKTRDGGQVKKRYHAPQTPAARLLASGVGSDVVQSRVRSAESTLDPLRLLDEIRATQHHLAMLAAGEAVHLAPSRDADLEGFLAGLAVAWRDGEVRPTHRAKPVARRDWRTRADPFEAVWPEVLIWLEAEPDRTGKEVFHRLQAAHPGTFPNGQIRTLQRRLKEWRAAAARRLVFTGADVSQPVEGARPGPAGRPPR